jgi:N-acetylglucosaminyldiphosphoundecaprenol N-acetyl-beta-D-mannosaminyltransferase
MRLDVLGVGISITSPEASIREICQWVEHGEQRYVCVTNVHTVMECQRDPDLRRIHNESGLTVPDGKPIVWSGRYAGVKEMEQVRGADLMWAVSRVAAVRGWSSFYYGGAPGTADLLAARFRERIPSLRVAGTFAPPFRRVTAAEDKAIIEMINESGADLVWVGLSAPKQEQWMGKHRSALNAPVLLGVGAAFDFHAGLKSQAPRWMQHIGLEWSYRLFQEPRRLWRRYAINNPAFIGRLARRRPSVRSAELLEQEGGSV